VCIREIWYRNNIFYPVDYDDDDDDESPGDFFNNNNFLSLSPLSRLFLGRLNKVVNYDFNFYP